MHKKGKGKTIFHPPTCTYEINMIKKTVNVAIDAFLSFIIFLCIFFIYWVALKYFDL